MIPTGSEFDNVKIKNILEHDFTFQYGFSARKNEDGSERPNVFVIPAGETITLSLYPARHAIKRLIDACIMENETYETDRRGKLQIQHGGHYMIDPTTRAKWQDRIIQHIDSVAVEEPKSVGDQLRSKWDSIIGKKEEGDAFANLNSSGDEVSKMSYPKLKKVASALGINSSEKGMTQEKLREEVRIAMSSEE